MPIPTRPYTDYLQKDEIITAAEFLRRRESGELSPGQGQYVAGGPGVPMFGGFRVPLKVPRYRVDVGSIF